MQEKKLKAPEKTAKSLSDYARYSNMAIQMIVILLIGVIGGRKLDQWLEPSFPVFTVVLSLLAVLLALYYAVKDLIKQKK